MFETTELFGKIHTSRPPSMAAASQRLRQQKLPQLEHLCRSWIPDQLLAPGPNQRQRIYTPKLTCLSFLNQVLHPGHSCRAAVRDIQSHYALVDPDFHIDAGTSAYCQARARLELSRLEKIRRHLAQAADQALPMSERRYPQAWLVDGTCLVLPDTPENQAAYPQPSSQKPGCGFPQLRMVGIFSLASGALVERRIGSYTTSEQALFRQLWPTFKPGDLILADRLFADYATLSSFQNLGLHGLFRLHAHRKADFRKGKKLGRGDRLMTWTKPQALPAGWTKEQWASIPATLTVRVIRQRIDDPKVRLRELIVVTTLLDPKQWPKELLLDLYCRRWRVEIHFDDLKTTLQMEMLSCLTPENLARELEMHLIAYNLIRAVMAEASVTCHVPLERLSFKGTLDTINRFAEPLSKIPLRCIHQRQAVYRKMLVIIAEDSVPERPGRREPRCLKKRPKAYPFMTKPRHEMKDPPKSFRRVKKTPKA